MAFDTDSHYERVAGNYDAAWGHAPDYVDWMNRHIADRLRPGPGARLADVGAGTGLFLRALTQHVDAARPIVCIDPSQAMLDQLPADPRLRPLCAAAEEVARRDVALPYDALDGVLAKEVVHHFADLPAALHGFGDLLAPGGRVLIVTLPPKLDYPLFQAALDRFAEHHVEPADIAGHLQAAGLRVDLEHEEFAIRVDREHYIRLVQNRWMSVLSTFDDDELEAGLEEIRAQHPEEVLRFVDRFAFVLGVKE